MAKIAFLYTEIAGYTVACLKALKASGTDILLIRWPVNPEAPFQFDLSGIAEDIQKSELPSAADIETKVREFAPDVLYVSGWIDKDYLHVAKGLRKKIPVVLGMDTPWQGNVRQKLGAIYAKLNITPIFSHAFVAGAPQQQFAKKLGFTEDRIFKGLYCADVNLFKTFYVQSGKANQVIPRRFLFVGRYIEQKGIQSLFDAYSNYRKQVDNPWELWSVGTGAMYDARPEIEGLRHWGFVQPEQLGDIIRHTGIFVLPSHYEPWGVVVQEYAVSGFPLICSNRVMAHTQFLQPNANGWLFAAGDSRALTDLMIKAHLCSDAQLSVMSEKSHALGLSHTPDIWAQTLNHLINVRN